MALINPVHGLVVPFLCVFTIPLAIFAGITTTLAFSLLMFRVAIVYLDIALTFIPQYVMGRGRARIAPATHRYGYHARDGSKSPTSSHSSCPDSGSGHSTPPLASPFPPAAGYVPLGYRSPRHRKSSHGFGGNSGRRSRRTSQASLASVGTITPIHEDDGTSTMAESGLVPSVGMDRDFEGIGGWRLDDNDTDWTNINSRLELPLERSSDRHHYRSQSAGPTTPGEGSWLMMKTTRKDGTPEGKDQKRNTLPSGRKASLSPNSSRVKMNQNVHMSPASTTRGDQENSYFPTFSPSRLLKKTAAQHS
ncbi:hypothetical protein QBC46DRAFT_384787 [Diplogelasinospora grovesii]|uniref:Uncharacterized protein n=1 Tax=Diplogelasinospora grovesii TaxID=303347 RepID=A0AAN6S513_9PEZI|nr:hypothetical protein QBC46DRAFT_384787 [Diplogelasinospora grovesii]